MDQTKLKIRLQHLRESVLQRECEIRILLREFDDIHSTSNARGAGLSNAFASALEERDHNLVDLQREADARLELIHRITHEAEERLALLEEATEALARANTTIDARDAEICSLKTQLEIISQAAQERLDLIEELHRSAEDLHKQIRVHNAANSS